MKKSLITFIMVSFLITLCFSFNILFTIHSFDSNSVKKHIEYLSSNNFKGRLGGSLENKETESFVKIQFKNNNLLPYSGKFYHPFNTKCPNRIPGKPYLTITNQQGNIIKEYKYSLDFKEDMMNFRKNKFSLNKKDSFKITNNSINITNNYGNFILYVPEKNQLKFRSSFISNITPDMFIMITKETFSDIKQHINKNFSLNCFIPFEVKKTTLNNVTGYIKGKKEKTSPIILSAHFDHVGYDLNNTIYPGALDNASGISFILEMSKYIKSLGKPDRNILFVGFNAEEFGCIGSNYFVNQYKNNLKNSKVFNYDMIGSNNSVPLCIMGSKKDTNKTYLINSVSSTCLKNDIYFNYLFEDCSDHKAFREKNIDAITFVDNDMSRIHTPEDKSTFISNKAIDRCFKVSSKEIIKHAFNNNIFLIYYKQISLISIIGLLICLKVKIAKHN